MSNQQMLHSIEDISTNLRTRGVYVSSQWLEQCIQFLMAKNIFCNRYNNANDPLLERVWEMYLDWDLREICDQQPFIPADLNTMHQTLLFTQQSFTLQIDEVSPICDSLSSTRTNGKEDNSKALESATALKVLITDGISQAVAYDFSGFLKSCQQGSKIRVRNVAVRRGAFILSPGDTELLGGEVKHVSVSVISNQNVSNSGNEIIVGDNEVDRVPDLFNHSSAIVEPDGISNLVDLSSSFETERSPSFVRTNLFPSSEKVQHNLVNSPLQLQQCGDLAFRLGTLEQHQDYNPICDDQQHVTTTENRHTSYLINKNPSTYITSCSLFCEEANNEMFLSDEPMVPEDLEVTVDDPSATQSRLSNSRKSSSGDNSAGLVYWSEVPQQPIGARFRIRGITESVTSFKIIPRPSVSTTHMNKRETSKAITEDAKEFYSTILFSDGTISYPAELSSQLVSAFLGVSPVDYQTAISAGSKKKQKEAKDKILCRFRNFHGIFWAERVEPSKSENEKGISILLLGYADDDIVQLCRDMMS